MSNIKTDKKVKEGIKIDKTHTDGGGSLGDLLKGCYFEPLGDSGKYDFRAPNGHLLNDKVRNQVPFKFRYLEIDWELTSDFSPTELKAHGSWLTPPPKDSEAEEGGTFTAQAGGGVATASSANA